MYNDNNHNMVTLVNRYADLDAIGFFKKQGFTLVAATSKLALDLRSSRGTTLV